MHQLANVILKQQHHIQREVCALFLFRDVLSKILYELCLYQKKIQQ